MPGKKKPTPPRAAIPKARVLEIRPDGIAATIELLNGCALFQRRIQFVWIKRYGTIIEAEFTNGRRAQWYSATDLMTFARSQAILFEATDFLIPTPTRRNIRELWEPVCQLIRNIAAHDAIDLEPALKDEFEGILRSTWLRSGGGENVTKTKEEFFAVLKETQMGGRKLLDHPPKCCVWAGGDGEESEHYAWVHLDSLAEWLSAPRGKGKYYQWDDIRRALTLLGFKSKPLNITVTKERVNVRVWRGPLDVLVDDDTKAETVIA